MKKKLYIAPLCEQTAVIDIESLLVNDSQQSYEAEAHPAPDFEGDDEEENGSGDVWSTTLSDIASGSPLSDDLDD